MWAGPGANLDPEYLYYAVVVALVVGMAVWMTYIPAKLTTTGLNRSKTRSV